VCFTLLVFWNLKTLVLVFWKLNALVLEICYFTIFKAAGNLQISRENYY